MTNKKAIILVAGLGSRLKPLTDAMPKCLTRVHGKAILINLLECLQNCGVEETVLVTGYLGDRIREAVGEDFRGMKVSYAVNDIYRTTSPTYSLWLGIKDMVLPDCLLVLEGDLFMDESILRKTLASPHPDLTVVELYHPPLEGTFVAVKDGVVTDCIGLKERPKDFRLDDKYKTINIHKFSRAFAQQVVIPTLKASVEETQGAEYFERVTRKIACNGLLPWRALETEGLRWFEIDDANDLKIAEEMFAELKGRS